MDKKEFHGIVMDVTRYNSSKDMMRRGLRTATTMDYSADNGLRECLEFMENNDIRRARSRAMYPAGYTGRPYGREFLVE